MADIGTPGSKRRLAGLTLSTLSITEGDDGRVGYQIVIAPSSAEFPKRTVTFDREDTKQLALELEIIAKLLYRESEA